MHIERTNGQVTPFRHFGMKPEERAQYLALWDRTHREGALATPRDAAGSEVPAPQ